MRRGLVGAASSKPDRAALSGPFQNSSLQGFLTYAENPRYSGTATVASRSGVEPDTPWGHLARSELAKLKLGSRLIDVSGVGLDS